MAMARFSERYVSGLLASEQYESLVELQGICLSWSGCNINLPDYGLPLPVFAFVEVSAWFAQSIRSGACTYFEATSQERQYGTHLVLQALGPAGFADNYLYGIEHWRCESDMRLLDRWISDNDDLCHAWLHALVQQHRNEILSIS